MKNKYSTLVKQIESELQILYTQGVLTRENVISKAEEVIGKDLMEKSRLVVNIKSFCIEQRITVEIEEI